MHRWGGVKLLRQCRSRCRRCADAGGWPHGDDGAVADKGGRRGQHRHRYRVEAVRGPAPLGRGIRRWEGRQSRGADGRWPARAPRLRDRGADLRGLRRRDGPARADRSAARGAGRRRRSGARGGGAGRAGHDRGRADSGRDRGSRPRGIRRARRRRGRRGGRSPLVGDRRGHGGGVVRGDERDLPQRARRRRGAGGGTELLVVALRRQDDLLPGQARLRAGRHGHRGGRPAPDRE